MAQITLNSSGVASNGSLLLQSNGTTTAVTIDASQNVGIGTASPTAKLDVATSINLSGQNYLNAAYDVGGGSGWLGGYNITYSSSAVRNVTTGALSGVFYASSGLQFYTNTSAAGGTAASERMRIDSSGNVGIGTSSPAVKLDVNGAINIASGNNITWGGVYGANIPAIYAVAGASGYIQFDPRGNSVTGMRLDSSGNLLVGTTSTLTTSGTGIRLLYTATTPQIAVTVSASSNNYVLYNSTASANRFFVSDAGQINATSTSITAISDVTLKENIRDLETGLTQVMALKPRRFDWKEETKIGETNVAGFIAQEVEQVLPELVYDYQYNAEETKKSLKMGDILPTLVKAIQEQQAIITQLQADVAALKGTA